MLKTFRSTKYLLLALIIRDQSPNAPFFSGHLRNKIDEAIWPVLVYEMQKNSDDVISLSRQCKVPTWFSRASSAGGMWRPSLEMTESPYWISLVNSYIASLGSTVKFWWGKNKLPVLIHQDFGCLLLKHNSAILSNSSCTFMALFAIFSDMGPIFMGYLDFQKLQIK